MDLALNNPQMLIKPNQTTIQPTNQLSDQTIKSIKLNSSKHCYVSVPSQLNIIHLFTHSKMIQQFFF